MTINKAQLRAAAHEAWKHWTKQRLEEMAGGGALWVDFEAWVKEQYGIINIGEYGVHWKVVDEEKFVWFQLRWV